MNEATLDVVRAIRETAKFDAWEDSFLSSIEGSKYEKPTDKQQAILDKIYNKCVKGIEAPKKASNPQWQDPLFLTELAIKKCTGKPEMKHLQELLMKALKEAKSSLMEKEINKTPSLDFDGIPF